MLFIRKHSWLVFFPIFIAISFVLWNQRFFIHDWVLLKFYTPTSEILELADSTSMNDYGRRLFYVNDPEVADSDSFNASCTHREQSIVLGCYNGSKIFIYNVTNKELSGIKQVTAAHEMLHAAYDRLSLKERSEIDKLLRLEFESVSNERVKNLIKTYEEQDPSIVPNELHSIIGTEIKSLSSDLEKYYSKYFADRQKVVSYSEQYESVFNQARSEAEALFRQLESDKAEIDSLEQRLNVDIAKINLLKQLLDDYRSAEKATEYNSLVPEYNQLVQSYNQGVASLKTMIEEYNSNVSTYNALALRQRELVQSIDSSVERAE